MPLLSDLRSSGGHYLYDLLNEPGLISADGAGDTAEATAADATVFTGTAGNAAGAGVTDTVSASTGEALGYAVVTIADPYVGYGSIFYPSNFDGTPANGDTVRYPTANGFTILADGTIIAEEYGEYVCYYDDGTGEVEFTVTIDDNAYVHADGVTATASASDADLYGGVNIGGDAPDVTATPAAATATAGNIASGAGATAAASASAATVAAGAEVSAEGVTAEATAATGVGETTVSAEGAGVEVEASAAEATASGDVFAVGGGATAVATAAAGTAVGDRRPGSIPYLTLTTVYPRNILIARAAA